MSPNSKKHRATDPVDPAGTPGSDQAPDNPVADAAGGAHRASRLPDLLIATGLGAALVVLVWILLARG